MFPGICIKDRQMSLASSPHRRVRSVHDNAFDHFLALLERVLDTVKLTELT